MPPITAYSDDVHVWVTDGNHRIFGKKVNGSTEIECDVQKGSFEDALLASVKANRSHGLRRTNEDKRKAVLTLLEGWPTWSDRQISDVVGVSPSTVGAVRKKNPEVSKLDTSKRKGLDGKTYTVKEKPQTQGVQVGHLESEVSTDFIERTDAEIDSDPTYTKEFLPPTHTAETLPPQPSMSLQLSGVMEAIRTLLGWEDNIDFDPTVAIQTHLTKKETFPDSSHLFQDLLDRGEPLPPGTYHISKTLRVTKPTPALKPLQTEADHEEALTHIQTLWSAEPDTKEYYMLDALSTLVRAYEAKHTPISPPEPDTIAVVEEEEIQKARIEAIRKNLRPLKPSEVKYIEPVEEAKALILGTSVETEPTEKPVDVVAETLALNLEGEAKGESVDERLERNIAIAAANEPINLGSFAAYLEESTEEAPLLSAWDLGEEEDAPKHTPKTVSDEEMEDLFKGMSM